MYKYFFRYSGWISIMMSLVVYIYSFENIQDLEVGVAWPNPKVLASKHETFEDGLTSNSKFGGWWNIAK